jgi:hypothetical protein
MADTTRSSVRADGWQFAMATPLLDEVGQCVTCERLQASLLRRRAAATAQRPPALDTDWRVKISREWEGETDARLRGGSACRLAPLAANHLPILPVGGEIRARLARGRFVSALSSLLRTELCARSVERVLDAQTTPSLALAIAKSRLERASTRIGHPHSSVGGGRCCRRGGKTVCTHCPAAGA